MEFLLIASTHFLALLSPGPDFFLIMQAALRLPLRYLISIAGGISLANGVYLYCAVFGIEVLKSNEWLTTSLKYGGACYLLFIGTMLLKNKNRPTAQDQQSRFFLQTPHLGKQFIVGFLSAILNPKNMLFYFSLFTVVVSSETSLSVRCLYALWMCGTVFIWDCMISIFLTHPQVKILFSNTITYIEKFTGIMLTVLGLSLPFF